MTEAFVAYLWGIETRLKVLILQDIGQFVAYLWGIETAITGLFN